MYRLMYRLYTLLMFTCPINSINPDKDLRKFFRLGSYNIVKVHRWWETSQAGQAYRTNPPINKLTCTARITRIIIILLNHYKLYYAKGILNLFR